MYGDSDNLSQSTGYTNSINIIQIACGKYQDTIHSSLQRSDIHATVDTNGQICMVASLTKNATNYVDVGYGHSPKIFITSFTSISQFTCDLYYKKYDKIIKNSYSVNSYVFTQTGTTEIGCYDYFIPMPNNDYFAVKNNQLIYSHFPQPQ